MTQIHKAEREPHFIRAVIAVLFLAACAYIGAKLFGDLNDAVKTVRLQCVTVYDSVELSGIAVRREQLVCSPAPAGGLPEDGKRLPAGGRIAVFKDGSVLSAEESALFYSDCDGLEALSPDMLDNLTVKSLEALLKAKPSLPGGLLGRTVTGYDWYFAALADADAPLKAGDSCKVQFEGMEQRVTARILSVSAPEGGKIALCLRLGCGGDEYMSLRKASAQLIFSQYTGLELPEEAVMENPDGSKFVYTLTAGVIEKKAVEIIYTADGHCLAALSNTADALWEGSTVIVAGEEIYEGRILNP